MKCTAFETGDGAPNDVGSDDEKYLRPKTTKDCIQSCIKEKKKDNAINGVTVKKGNDDEVKICVCERNMAKVLRAHTDWKTCFLVPN